MSLFGVKKRSRCVFQRSKENNQNTQIPQPKTIEKILQMKTRTNLKRSVLYLVHSETST